MKVEIVYVHPIAHSDGYDQSIEAVSGTYDDCARRFVDTYRKFPAEYEHTVTVVFSGLLPTPDRLSIYENFPFKFLCYTGPGWCSGAHQHAARESNADFCWFSSARTHFWRAGWLKRLMEARVKHGYGMYGTMTSNESGPHIRTNFYGMDPAYFRTFEHPLLSREDTWRFEHGDWNASVFHAKNRMASMLVTWDGEYSMKDWRKPDNIFRRGDQSNLVVWDRHTEIYSKSTESEKLELERLVEG